MQLREALNIPDTEPGRRDKHPKPVPDDFKLHWRIYYRDGTRIGSHERAWEDAPSSEIVAIVQAINDERATVELGTPYYWKFSDFIARVWDVTLYLRQTGLVKFGRWTDHGTFDNAWRLALTSINPKKDEPPSDASLQSGVCVCTERVDDAEVGTSWKLWYDDQRMFFSEGGDHLEQWKAAPPDGILVAQYSIVYSGVKLNTALRRYSMYYWRGHELRNTDDLNEVLSHFPQCKQGRPEFIGPSYRHQGQAIAQAFADQLEDVR